MITLELTPNEICSLSLLEEGETIEVEYHGLPCFIAYYGEAGNVEINGRRYSLGFYDPTEWRIKESKMVNVTVIFHFLNRQSEMRKFRTYHCCVIDAIKRLIKEVPELRDCTDYRYTMTDNQGRLVR